MNEESRSPEINVNVLLFNAEEAHIGVVWHINHGDLSHQEGKKGKQDEPDSVGNIGMPDIL